MSQIIPILPLKGELSLEGHLLGTLSSSGSLEGIISISPPPPGSYSGPYEVSPKADEDVTLPTFNKLMNENLEIKKIPYYETSNESGITVYIGG